MKSVLLLSDSLTSGGAQRQIVGLAKLLHEMGYNVKLTYYHKIEFYKPFLDSNGVPNELIKGAANPLKRVFKIRRVIKQMSPDVVISYLDTPNVITCLLRAFGMRYKLIASERNTTQVLTRSEKVKFFLMRWADVIVPNSFSQEKFIQNNFPKLVDRVTTITNFVDTDAFAPSEISQSPKCRILTVGRVSEQKNTMRFLEALSLLKEQRLDFYVDWYGYSSLQYLEQCERYIEDNDLSDVFTFHEPASDIVLKYQGCDLFVLPSVYEGFPNVICEAMSCGKPILCGDICDNPIIVDDGENGYLFDPYQVEDIVDKLKSFMQLSIEEKIKMGNKSRLLALEKFSSKSFIKKYIDIIES